VGNIFILTYYYHFINDDYKVVIVTLQGCVEYDVIIRKQRKNTAKQTLSILLFQGSASLMSNKNTVGFLVFTGG